MNIFKSNLNSHAPAHTFTRYKAALSYKLPHTTHPKRIDTRGSCHCFVTCERCEQQITSNNFIYASTLK